MQIHIIIIALIIFIIRGNGYINDGMIRDKISNNDNCFEMELKSSQNCDNQDLFYFDISDHHSGFGSEFNHYFVHSFINAVTSNRRHVHINIAHNWFYGCDNKQTWSCYLEFPCKDSIIYNPNEMTLTNNSNNIIYNARFHSYGREELMKKIVKAKKNISNCDMKSLNPTIITSIAANYLFKLNNSTKALVDNLNHEYNLKPFSYLSVQIRTTDKHLEVDKETWDFITNMTRVAIELKKYVIKYVLKDIFIATDNCQLIDILRNEMNISMKHNQILIYSSCNNNKIEKMNPRSNHGYQDTVRLLSDIEMLRNGKIFLGLIESNLVRMVYRLRYPNHQKTFFPIYLSSKQQHNRNVALDNLIN